jgi:LysR family glycine cleavage system transcriptional activator
LLPAKKAEFLQLVELKLTHEPARLMAAKRAPGYGLQRAREVARFVKYSPIALVHLYLVSQSFSAENAEEETNLVLFSHMPRRLPSLNALQAFEAAGRHGRMTLAAHELSVTHGAVSRQVRHLEELLGVDLFDGPKHALRLTEAGCVLLGYLTSAFDTIDRGVQAVRAHDEALLDVSCPGTFMMRWLIPRLHRFRAGNEASEVRLRASDRPADFARENYTIAVRVIEQAPDRAIHVTELFPEDVGPVLSPRLARGKSGKEWDAFREIQLLHTRTRPHAWAAWTASAGWDNVAGRPGTEFEHFYFMLEAATAGLGICIAPWPLVIDDLRSGRLVAPFGFRPSGQIYVAMRRNRRDPRAESFCAWLAAEARATPRAPVASC